LKLTGCSSLSLRTFGEDIVKAPINQDQKLNQDKEAVIEDVEEDVAAVEVKPEDLGDEEELANAASLDSESAAKMEVDT
jgi:hypothetical protein